jgi:hypothetical protein
MIARLRPISYAGPRRVMLVVLAAWVASGAPPLAQSYVVPQSVVAGGGGPIAGGAYSLVSTVGESGAGGPLASGTYSLVGGFWAFAGACPAIVLSATTFPAGRAGTVYSATTLTQTGGTGPVTFAVTGGALPPGLTLSSAGAVTGLPTQAGAFTFAVTATQANGCTGSRAYALTVAAAPVMGLDKAALVFGASSNGTALVSKTGAQGVRLTQTGAGTVTWTAATNKPWLTVSPASGSGSADLTISVAFAPGLTATQTGSITLTFAGAGTAAASIGVTFNVAADAAAPFGAFDTPADGTPGVTGSVAVTGWALDDIDVTGVRVLRDPVAGETPGQLVFIGNAVFIEGARTDVQAAYPALPRNARAGWGYLMLTNFLPNHGNGTFTLRAIADDADGHATLLGSKTITCTNATAIRPLGAIDTPEQGQTIGGAAYVNFGWVLAAQPTASGRFIPFDGSTIQVFVDSVSIGTPASYNNARADIQGLFPGYANTDGAVGVKFLNTTTLANGLHTIFWVATDNMGSTAGIGSRYFRVSNSGAALVAAPPGASVIESGTAIVAVHGFDANTAADVVAPDSGGIRTVRVAPLGRVAITLDPVHAATAYRGYELIDGQSMPLPIGSTLDARTGEFLWMPGLAFGGTHHLVFIRATDGREERILVDVTIGASLESPKEP